MIDWKELVRTYLARTGQSQYEDVVMATIEAETAGKNITGDSGKATGYGQVWLNWHFDSLQKAYKNIFNITLKDVDILPGKGYDLTSGQFTGFQHDILNDNQLSIGLAAETIIKVFNQSNQNYDVFIKKYVGPSTPDKEVKRRWDIFGTYGTSKPLDFNFDELIDELVAFLQKILALLLPFKK